MTFRPIRLAISAPLLLTCCAPSPPAIEAAPPSVLVRPPCTPPHELMAAPSPLAALAQGRLSESQAVAAWIDDMAAYQMLREQTQKLQTFIQSDCQ
jgi:hypothetical protein